MRETRQPPAGIQAAAAPPCHPLSRPLRNDSEESDVVSPTRLIRRVHALPPFGRGIGSVIRVESGRGAGWYRPVRNSEANSEDEHGHLWPQRPHRPLPSIGKRICQNRAAVFHPIGRPTPTGGSSGGA